MGAPICKKPEFDHKKINLLLSYPRRVSSVIHLKEVLEGYAS